MMGIMQNQQKTRRIMLTQMLTQMRNKKPQLVILEVVFLFSDSIKKLFRIIPEVLSFAIVSYESRSQLNKEQ